MDKKRRGRQKISMEKMKNDSNLQVTFSKRRAGLFKKVSEICTLCGVEAAVIVFSPGQKVYSFGHPSVDAIVNRYINSITNASPVLANHAPGVLYNANTIQQLNRELTGLQELLDNANGRSQFLKNLKKVSPQPRNWFDVTNKNELNLQQLECLKAMMENVQTRISRAQQNIILEAQNIANMGYQTPHINPFDAQTNVVFPPFPNPNVPTSGGAGSSGTNPWSFD